jgi:ELWxxDGT repeat protein
LGGKALFVGEDTSGNISLWSTDGTGAGTNELTAAGSNATGLFFNVTEPDFTVLGNKVLFAGQDAAGNSGLWVTNGTAGGTRELMVAGANAGGLFDLHHFSTNFSPEFTVLGNLALFEGYDARGVDGLWVTDGTAAGTHELTVAGSYASGLFANVSAPDFTVVGSTVLFAGDDASGNANLWITNGTSAGTSELTAAGASPSALSPNDFVGLPTSAGGPTSDFNGDGTSDILWQNTNGQAATWLLNNAAPFNQPVVGSNPGSSWQVIGAGDFNGDGDADILWQNTDGQPAIWVMNGTTPVSEPVVGANPGPSWQIVGTGYFDGLGGGGDSDILWQNTNGQAAIWLMNGTTPVSEPVVGANPGPSWHIVGTGDFNGDGNSDILWQNTNGQAAIWLMDGTTPLSEPVVGGNPGPSWHIVGTGDFNGDGNADILWQNTNGQAAIWLMNGTTPTAEVLVGGNPGPSWHIVGTGDYNGDGKSDILWQNDNGQASIWLMNGTTPTAEVLVGNNPGPTWHIHAAS